MSGPQQPENGPIAKAVSKLAAIETKDTPDHAWSFYQEEEHYAEKLAEKGGQGFLGRFSKALKVLLGKPENDRLARQYVTPEDVVASLSEDNARHELREKKDTHLFRKLFLVALFVLVCIWLFCVVYFVNRNGTSPSMAEREKLIQIQNQIVTMALDSSNTVDSAMIKMASPTLNKSYFQLSDSVLIAFITSTTVAVIGLFLTAANWLFKRDKP